MVCKGPDHSRDCLDSCSSGYFTNPLDGSCGRCSPNCNECLGTPENCSLCDKDKFLNRTGNYSSCVFDCRRGQFGDPTTRICLDCSPACSDCIEKRNKCTECPVGKHLLENSCVENCTRQANKIVSGVPNIRLVGVNSSTEGRVELFYQGEWGTVCDDSFDMKEAMVICRQLKLGGAIYAYNSAKYGQGTGKILMDDIQCSGNERRLQDCPFHAGGFGSHNCHHSEDAGVKCSGPDLSTRCVSNCEPGFYDTKTTCKRCLPQCKECLGKAERCSSCNPPYFLEFSDCVKECPFSKFGNTKNRKCEPCDKQCQSCYNGETNNLCKSCREGLFLKGMKCVEDCGEMKPVSSLFPSKLKKPLVRLVDGNSKQEGRVEVFYAGMWGTVCDDDWDLKEASIVCKELGFGKAIEAPKHSKFGQGSGIIWMDNVNCLGYETSLTQCRQIGWGLTNCDPFHGEDAGVVCDNTTVEEISNNYCRRVNDGKCEDKKECDLINGVTCVNLNFLDQSGVEESVCLQCPDGTAGDGRECRAIASSPPIFEDFPPSRKEVNAEDVISLPCRSKPPRVYPTVRDWRKDGKPLLEKDITSNRITSSGGQLLIKSATREDSGNYTCSLVNCAGNVTSNSSQVIVKEAPRILGVVSTNVRRGDDAVLSCVVSSFPPSNITWKFKGKTLKFSDRLEFLDDTYTLKVKKVTFEDAGSYECSLTNELGEARANATLTVGLTVMFEVFPTNTVGKKGATEKLECKVTGIPTPKVAWKKDGELLMNASKHTITTNISAKNTVTSRLLIKDLSKEDIGIYYCISWNRGGIGLKETSLLLPGPPIITIPPKDVHILSNANASFFCVGMGYPNPSLTWVKDSKPIQQSTRIFSTDDNALWVLSATVDDVGMYTCVYKNKYGEVSESASLYVDGIAPGKQTVSSSVASRQPISTGKIVAIVVILVVIIAVIVGIVLYRYCRSHDQTFKFSVNSRTLKPSLRSRVKNAMGKNHSANLYYNHSQDEINFDDSRPFADQDEL